MRSIPASAGEPLQLYDAVKDWQVYPRECGGTLSNAKVLASRTGLSPRVRGNRLPPLVQQLVNGSIPASAGEPTSNGGVLVIGTVYPRECGGTIAIGKLACSVSGLSPRVRGNRVDAL